LSVYSGKTGLLDLTDMQNSDHINGLFINPTSSGQMPATIYDVLLTAGELAENKLQTPYSTKSKLYQNLGPFQHYNRSILALIRIIDVKPSFVPDSIELSISKKSVVLDEQNIQDEIFSVKDKVIEDLKILSGMGTAREKAEEFLKIAEQQGWDIAVEQFNKKYPPEEKDDPNNFELVTYPNLNKFTKDMANIPDARDMASPGTKFSEIARLNEIEIRNILFDQIPKGSGRPKQLPFILEVKPAMRYFCVKDMSMTQIDQKQYLHRKAYNAYRISENQQQSLAIAFFSPQNIISRTNFRYIEEEEQTKEPNEPADANDKQDS
jgi:hypothetical protein